MRTDWCTQCSESFVLRSLNVCTCLREKGSGKWPKFSFYSSSVLVNQSKGENEKMRKTRKTENAEGTVCISSFKV